MNEIIQILSNLKNETITIIIVSILALIQLIRVIWRVIKEKTIIEKLNIEDVDELSLTKGRLIFKRNGKKKKPNKN